MIRRILPFAFALIALLVGAVGGEALRARTAPAGLSGPKHPPGEGAEAPGPEASDPAASDDPSAPRDAISPGEHGASAASGSQASADVRPATIGHDDDAKLASFSFPQQFFVPLVRGGNVQGVMILSLSIEMPEDQQEAVFKKENQLRDALLRQLLIHANTGGFDGNFTADAHVALLRAELLASARKVAGDSVVQVLIGDISRQDG